MMRILRVLPEELNVHGDAENALVLARRAEWSGIDASVVDLPAGGAVPAFRPDAIVVGSGTDPMLEHVAARLAPLAGPLRDWVADGVPLLAVGTGFELLAEEVQTGSWTVRGLGIFPARVVPLPSRATGDLAVRSSSRVLIGFENHARGAELLEGAAPLGQTIAGIGNGTAAGGAAIEGCIAGTAMGTHLHGPVLARNPDLADDLLTAMAGSAYDAANPSARAADELAAASRARTTASLGIRL